VAGVTTVDPNRVALLIEKVCPRRATVIESDHLAALLAGSDDSS
jgi:hypothetical protein